MDYQGNSRKGKAEKAAPEKKNIEKVVTGEVITRKVPLGRRIKETFFGGDFKNAAQYIAADVLLPALKNAIVDATSKGIERAVYGDVGPRRVSEGRGRVTYNTPVSRSYREPRANVPDQPSRRVERSSREGTEIILSTRSEAEAVLERMQDIIESYDVVSMADLRELVGLQSTPVDNKWGWSSLFEIEIIQIREGYLLDLPDPEVI